jgi:hypothetical protein
LVLVLGLLVQFVLRLAEEKVENKVESVVVQEGVEGAESRDELG